MNLLPKASGNRPRVACEIFADGVVAARSPEPGSPLAAVARADLSEGAVLPGLKPGNVVDRMAVIAALRRVLEQVSGRANARNGDLTLVIPDGAVRVLLLDFDSFPNKLSEALPIVRFRLKKLVPFDADEAMISFQVMSTTRSLIRVLAVAIPRDVLVEYESVAREAGFEPGAVLPSTLAALAGSGEADGASLVVNAHPTGVTTAIVRSGILLLHRSIELAEPAAPTPANLPAALFEPSAFTGPETLPLVNREDTASEWAAQEPPPAFGRSAYVDGIYAESAVENEDGATGRADAYGRTPNDHLRRAQAYSSASDESLYAREPAPVEDSPYAGPTVTADLSAELHEAVLVAPTSPGSLTDPAVADELHTLTAFAAEEDREPPVHVLAADAQADEIARAVSVAVAYFEDSLNAVPAVLLSAGPLGAEGLDRLLREQGIAQENGLRVRELVGAEAIAPGAVSASVPRGWLAGVMGALST